MNRKFMFWTAVAVFFALPPAFAALPMGARAPVFTAQAARGDKAFSFSLAKALKKGPVVVFFFPAAFTGNSTAEARGFAAALDKYHALGATVIGVSHDSLAVLKRFSTNETWGRIPLVSDVDQKIMTSYDAALPAHPRLADRTTYVIAPDGKIIFAFTDMKPDKHVANSLAALKVWRDNGHPLPAVAKR